MSHLHHRIRSLRLPKVVLYSCATVILTLDVLVGLVAVSSKALDESQTIEYSANLRDYSVANFRGGRLFSYDFNGLCSELISIDVSSFDSKAFNSHPPIGETLRFRIHAKDTTALNDCARCEIVALTSVETSYLTLQQWNREVMGVRRTVSSVIAVVLGLAGFTLLWLGRVSPGKNEFAGNSDNAENWERFRVS